MLQLQPADRRAFNSRLAQVWAIGVLAAGQASTMVCTYAGQLIMNGCLEIELPAWKRVALTRVIALGPALFVAVMTTSTPGALNSVNEYLNSACARARAFLFFARGGTNPRLHS